MDLRSARDRREMRPGLDLGSSCSRRRPRSPEHHRHTRRRTPPRALRRPACPRTHSRRSAYRLVLAAQAPTHTPPRAWRQV
eukprot:scaffold9354_cov108-Isochrysis_galbana.AAC.5